MSDLSRLLEDVYRSGPATPAAPAAPSWSSDAALEEAFADWVPGPSDDAPAAEREFGGTEFAGTEFTDSEDFAETELDRSDTFDQLDSLVQQALGTDDDEDEPPFEAAEETAVEPAAATESRVEFQEAVFALVSEPVAVVAARTWCRQDDDILPSRGRARRRMSLKRR